MNILLVGTGEKMLSCENQGIQIKQELHRIGMISLYTSQVIRLTEIQKKSGRHLLCYHYWVYSWIISFICLLLLLAYKFRFLSLIFVYIEISCNWFCVTSGLHSKQEVLFFSVVNSAEWI